MRPFLISIMTLASGLGGCAGAHGGAGTAPGRAPVGGLSSEVGANKSLTPPEDLTPREQREWRAAIERLISPCPGSSSSVAQCLSDGDSCGVCEAAADFVAASIEAGFDQAQLEQRYLVRFDPRKVQKIPVEGKPSMGPADAPVTVVEFADFECPFCGASVPLFDKLVEAYKPYVRLVFYNFPISYHPHGEQCARAAVAADMQGKFWQLHHAMYAHQRSLSRKTILQLAEEAGLDMARFERDLDSGVVDERVKQERRLGDDVGVPGTPGVFINGRLVDVHLFDLAGADLMDWVELEIKMKTGKTVHPKD